MASVSIVFAGDVVERLAGGPAFEVGEEELHRLVEPGGGVVGGVGREEHVVHCPEGVGGGERLGVIDVEHGAADAPAGEGADEGGFLDDGPAADVDQDGVGGEGG